MSFEYSSYVLPLLAAAVVSAIVAVYTWIRRSANGALALFVLAVFVFEWIVSYLLEVMGTGLETKYFFGVLEYIGIAFVPYSWLIFSIVYSGQEQVVSRRFLALTALIPFITVLLAWTTRWHGLVWSEYRIASQGDFSALEVISHGPWFPVHLAYSYISLLIGAFFLVRILFRRKGMYRGQIAAMLIAVLAPWVGNVLFLTGNSPIPYLDLTPFAFTVSVAAVAWAVFGFRLVDITPLARDQVVDSMREGMIVLDVRANIVDINNAAARMIGVLAANALGKPAADIFQPWSHLVERFRNVMEARDEITVGEGEAIRRYEVRFSPLNDTQGQFVGRVILLRAMDEQIPRPKLAEETIPGGQAQPSSQPEHGIRSRIPVIAWLIDFFFVPEKSDLFVPPGVNPSWYRSLERNFTVVLRIGVPVMIVGTWLATGLKNFPEGRPILFALDIFMLILGLARGVSFRTRATLGVLIVYAAGLLEIFGYGRLTEGLLFFVAFIVGALLALGRKNGFTALLISLVTLLAFALLTNLRLFVPLAIPPGSVLPFSLTLGIGSTFFMFAGAVFGLYYTIASALESLNRAWYLEVQSANLLQQERDLLEQRVEQRTHDLAEARDQAITISRQMRKYYRAIEQSGNTIVITDTQGIIEYVNPMFEKSTGYNVAEAIGNNPRILKSGHQSPEYYANLWRTINSGQVWTGEFLNKRKDGSLYWESATIAPVQDQNGVITHYVAVKEDITARRQADEQLRKLSRAVEQSGNTVIMMDRHGLIEYVNPKFSQVTGFSPQEATGQSPIALMNGFGTTPDFRRDEWWLTVNAGRIWHGEFQNHRKDGSLFWESATIAPVQNSSGEIINFVEIKQDISEQKILQDQLQKQNDYLSILHQITLDLLNRRELNDLLQVIVDRSAILLDAPFSELMLEQDGNLIVEAFTANQPNLKGDRVTRSQAKLSWQAFDTHQPVVLDDYSTWEHKRDIYDEDALHAVADFPVMAGDRCLGILALGRSMPDYTFTPEQIETGILFARLVALVLDNASLYDSAMKEISERKRTEILLLESEIRFRQIVENASDIIYRADASGQFTYANPAALRLMGFAREEDALGRHYLELTTPDFRQKLKRVYDRQYVSKTRNTYFEFPAVTMQGEVLWIGQNVQLIMENDQVTGFQAVARDITQLKQAQEALAISRDQALDASRFKSQLLSRVSHELRTPLGGILGYAELLEYKAFGSLTEKQLDAVSNIIESTNYLTELVNDLLDEAQIESKSISLSNEYFNPADLLEKIRTSMSVLAAKKGLACRVEISSDLPSELYGDVSRLQQVIINLTGNAIKFTKSGEVSVNLRRPAPAQWSIEVRDTGVGIPASEQQGIFEPFRQVSNSITRENRGSGLGLAITKQLVELMGGQISLESQIGKGSLFTVTLPITNAPGE